jgi:hypothetical protein
VGTKDDAGKILVVVVGKKEEVAPNALAAVATETSDMVLLE